MGLGDAVLVQEHVAGVTLSINVTDVHFAAVLFLFIELLLHQVVARACHEAYRVLVVSQC